MADPFSLAAYVSTLRDVMASIETISEDADRYDADELGQYRSLSTLSVVAFVLGLCSVVTFASPLMMVVPLAAAATALLALNGIAASDGGLTGARLARWGLALAILFVVAAFTRVKVRDLLLQRQADRVARIWLALAADGRAESMLELMTKTAADKLTPAVESGQAMPFFGGILASALLRQDPVVLSLTKLRETGEINYRIQDTDILTETNPPQVSFRYVASNANSEQRLFIMTLKRFRASQQEQVWLIDSWQLE